jgi:hypothetical protein
MARWCQRPDCRFQIPATRNARAKFCSPRCARIMAQRAYYKRHRDRRLAEAKARRKPWASYADKENARLRERYATDPIYREKKLLRNAKSAERRAARRAS